MQLPPFWRRASFTIAESAALIGAHEDALRNWIAHSITPHVGEKTGRRIYLSGLDMFYWSLVKQLTAFGVPVRTAMASALTHAAVDLDDARSEFLVVRCDGEDTHFSLTDVPTFSASTLVIPLRAHLLDLVEAAAAIYSAGEK